MDSLYLFTPPPSPVFPGEAQIRSIFILSAMVGAGAGVMRVHIDAIFACVSVTTNEQKNQLVTGGDWPTSSKKKKMKERMKSRNLFRRCAGCGSRTVVSGGRFCNTHINAPPPA